MTYCVSQLFNEAISAVIAFELVYLFRSLLHLYSSSNANSDGLTAKIYDILNVEHIYSKILREMDTFSEHELITDEI